MIIPLTAFLIVAAVLFGIGIYADRRAALGGDDLNGYRGPLERYRA